MAINEIIESQEEALSLLEENNEKNIGVLFITKKGIGDNSTQATNLLIKLLTSIIQIKNKPKYIIFSGNSIFLLNENEEIVKIISMLKEYNINILICDDSLKEHKIELKKNL